MSLLALSILGCTPSTDDDVVAVDESFTTGSLTWASAPEGFSVTSGAGTFMFQSLDETPVAPSTIPSPDDPTIDRVAYQRANHVEWYEDHGGRLKQGFDIASDLEPGPIQLRFAVETEARGSTDLDQTELAFRDANNAPVLSIDGLVAWDAVGEELVGWMEYSCDPLCVWTIVVDDENATYPVTIDPWIQGTLQRVSDNSSNRDFGFQVSTADGWGAVGVPLFAGNNRGKVEMWRHNGTTWVFDQQILGGNGDQCGASVDVQEDRLLIGCTHDGSSDEGTARVYRYNGSNWVSEATLGYTAGAAPDLLLGTAVELSPDSTRACISGTGDGMGRMMIFERSGTSWTEVGSFTGTEANSLFGMSCSIDGDRAVVGAPEHDGVSTTSGALHTYVRTAGTWSADSILQVTVGSQHGRALDLDGDQMAAWRYGSGGRVVMWEHDGTSWTEGVTLGTAAPAAANGFGTDVDLDGDLLLAGEFRGDTFVTDAGSAYIFESVDGVWTQQLEIAPTAAQGAAANLRFGRSLELDDGRALIGTWPQTGTTVETAYFVDVAMCRAYVSEAGCTVDLRITEVHADPVNATSDGSFIELANTGTDDVDLFGLQIETAAGTVTVDTHVTLSAGNVMAFAPSISTASDMPDIDGVRELSGLVLDAGGETIRLLDRDGVEFESFTTPALPEGSSWQLSYDGDWTSNDWCLSLKAGEEGDDTVDFFTPGAVNESCSLSFPFTFTYLRTGLHPVVAHQTMSLDALGTMSTTNSGEGTWSVDSDATGQSLSITYTGTGIIYLGTKDFGASCFDSGTMDVTTAHPSLDVVSGTWVNDGCP